MAKTITTLHPECTEETLAAAEELERMAGFLVRALAETGPKAKKKVHQARSELKASALRYAVSVGYEPPVTET